VDAPRREIILPRAAYVVGAILLTGAVVYWLRDVLTPRQSILSAGAEISRLYAKNMRSTSKQAA
jgi:hypothetical protein